jgi:hypothetical protein
MADGRNLNGHFAPGNRIGKGNLGNKRMAELRRALLDSATPDRVKAVAEALYEMAVGGDVSAAKVWLEFTVGKPVQAVELSTPEDTDIGMIGEVMLAALGDDPDARIKVANAFRRLAAMEAPAN